MIPKPIDIPTVPQLPPHLAYSESASDVVELLAGFPDWMTTRQLHHALDCLHRYHGLSTLKRTLARLVASNVLEASHRKPYGYRLAAERPQLGLITEATES